MDYHNCKGTSSPLNLCPGPQNIQCCLPHVYANCNNQGVSGMCVDVNSCTGTHVSGLCPGPNNVQCCTPSQPRLIDVPLVCQLPQLKNGCEVTSLTMLLLWVKKNVDKMTLASQIAKDPTPYQLINGVIHWGNPNVGFVGDITGNHIGYSVYHGPVLNLARRYYNATDLTGQSFTQILSYVAAGRPVWVITSFTFQFVPADKWHTVISREGTYKMTFVEHSVVITGFDSSYVWVNDPYANIKNRQLNRAGFEAGWAQFGNQAIVLGS